MGFQVPSLVDIISYILFSAFPIAILVLLAIRKILHFFPQTRTNNWFLSVAIASIGSTVYFVFTSGNSNGLLYTGLVGFIGVTIFFAITLIPVRLMLLAFKKSIPLGVVVIVGAILVYLFFFPKKHFWFVSNGNILNAESRYEPAIHCQCLGIENSLQQRPSTCFGIPYACVVIEKTDRCPLWPKDEPCPMYGLFR